MGVDDACVLLNGKKQKARPKAVNLKVRWRAKVADVGCSECVLLQHVCIEREKVGFIPRGWNFFFLELELQISTPRPLKNPVQFPCHTEIFLYMYISIYILSRGGVHPKTLLRERGFR